MHHFPASRLFFSFAEFAAISASNSLSLSLPLSMANCSSTRRTESIATAFAKLENSFREKLTSGDEFALFDLNATGDFEQLSEETQVLRISGTPYCGCSLMRWSTYPLAAEISVCHNRDHPFAIALLPVQSR